MNKSLSEAENQIAAEELSAEVARRFGSDRAGIATRVPLGPAATLTCATVYPSTAAELAEVIKVATSENWPIVPAGAATWLEMGNPIIGAPLVVSTARMNRVLEYEPADLTATVQAGCTLAAFNQGSAPHRQFIPLDPFGDERQTLGAIVATASFGPLRCGFGTPRDWVIGMQVARTDGSLNRAGGKVVKNVAGYDLCKLYTGSYGTLAIITELSFKLRPMPPTDRTVVCASKSIVDLFQMVSRLLDSDLNMASLEVLTPSSIGLDHLIDRPYALVVRFLDEAETIASEEVHLQGLSGGIPCFTLTTEQGSEFWRHYRSNETSPIWSWSFRISVLPSAVPEMVQEIQRVLPMSAICIHAAHGIIRVMHQAESIAQSIAESGAESIAQSGAQAGKASATISSLRLFAQARGGQLVILRRPASEAEVDVWGDVGQTARLMRELKEKFDPGHRLNTGRFAAGI